MAGIGFTLRKLVEKDDLMGLARAGVHSTIAAAGPWLFTVLAIGGITLYHSDFTTRASEVNFRIIIIYNFAFSLVMSAPIFMVVTRMLADAIHRRDVTGAPGLLLGSLCVLFATQCPVAAWFYLYYVDLPLELRLMALVNVFLISAFWILGVFLTALKDYLAVSRNFLAGMVLALLLAIGLKPYYDEAGMLAGFSIGLAWVVFALTARVFAEYPYRLRGSLGLFRWFKPYWRLALAGFFYNFGIWVDKWVMWFAPERTQLPSGMIMYSDYDSAMFLAYLTIVPSLAMFMFAVETNFFERYLKFYRDILNHANWARIADNQKRVLASISRAGRNFILFQGGIALIAILLAAPLFDALHINFQQIGMFRFGVLGAFFHALTLFGLVGLSYFDCRKTVLCISLLFAVTNGGFTWISMQMGFPYYGYGYFVSGMVTFLATVLALFHYVRNLPYHSFITNNTSLKGA